ncbi:MAG: hypothetical protein OXS28_06720 [Gammaproteobacteria bacterium]|nr:hypothetical protein [Gammaproteobacteria bacterium]MDE0282988.1 hypothetical protein [Gammaproteobacteria bacterium]
MSIDIDKTNAAQSGGVNQQEGVTSLPEGKVSYNGVTMSVFEAVSMLFVERAQTYSTLTADRLKSAQDNLKSIKEARAFLGKVRDLAKKDGINDIPKGLPEFCKEHNITLPSDEDGKYDKDEFKTVTDNLQGGLDNMQDTNQIEMLKLKTSVNNMDTSITGASKNEEKLYGTTKDIVSGLGR